VSARRTLGLVAPLGVMYLAIVVAATTALNCSSRSGELPPPCTTKDLAAIETAYIAEAVETCRGRTVATCPELRAVEAKYARKREEWVRCP